MSDNNTIAPTDGARKIFEGEMFRMPDGRFLVVREVFADGAVGADVYKKEFPLLADWTEIPAENLAGFERLPRLETMNPTTEDLLQ